MENYECPNTKLALVLAAGELFAEKGFDGVSTREIAQKANARLGSIHYHFQTKEKLYIEAFRYALNKGNRKIVKEIIAEHPKRLESASGLAEIIWEAIQDFFQDVLSRKDPQWKNQLITRELYSPSAAMPRLVQEVFRSLHEDIKSLYFLCHPHAQEEDATVWALFLPGIATFYNHNQAILLEVLQKKSLDIKFIQKLTKATAKMMILYLGLPLPKEL
ncbi:MAG: TetR/AcrR family transcriptional regulator [Candidatus Brocadiae bacterium]|nr:TetR/AcrR family transcriptional regulator [Candidatus Brocadiia bacterium]